jgi:hypothetical protein
MIMVIADTPSISRRVVQRYRGRVVSIRCGQILSSGNRARYRTDSMGSTTMAVVIAADITQRFEARFASKAGAAVSWLTVIASDMRFLQRGFTVANRSFGSKSARDNLRAFVGFYKLS